MIVPGASCGAPELIDDPPHRFVKAPPPDWSAIHVPQPVIDYLEADLQLRKEVADSHPAVATHEAAFVVARIHQRGERRPVRPQRRRGARPLTTSANCYSITYQLKHNIRTMAKPSQVDRGSPLPLYHQIAVTLRYRIATGQIAAGTALASYRLAAGEWGANLHTVRRAYQELQEEGLIRIDDRRGAVVIQQPRRGPGGNAFDRFLAETIRTAGELYGADVKTIIEALHRSVEGVAERPAVWVLECSKALALALAEQINIRWGVDARPWLVDRVREVPPGAIVSTYFHFNDLRHALPQRLVDLEFVHIRPSAAVLDVVRNRLRQVGGHRVQVLETDAAFAHGLLADLHHYFGTDVVIDLQLPSDPAAFLRQRTGRDPVLVSPKNWDRLDQSLRRRSQVYELTYVADETDLKKVAQQLGWRAEKQLAGAVG